MDDMLMRVTEPSFEVNVHIQENQVHIPAGIFKDTKS